jgi:hypothetical protein
VARNKPLTAREFAKGMADPDKVGQSEYRILHELVQEIAEGDGDLYLIESSMDEVIGWATTIRNEARKDIAKAKRGMD